MPHARTIPCYSLFGDAPDLIEPGFCHVERLEQRLMWHGQFVEDHSHPHLCQMTLWLSGGGLYRADEIRAQIAPGLLCWMPAGFIHGFEVEPGTKALVLSMSEDFAREQLSPMLKMTGQVQVREKLLVRLGASSFVWIRQVFERIEYEYAKVRFAQLDAIGSMARLILAEALRAGLALDRARTVAPGPAAELVAKFLSKIEDDLTRRISIEAFAQELGSTPYLLNRACRDALGMRASDLVRARHVQEAKRLLLFTALRVNSIAALVGYEDPAHFARCFRAATGQTPRAWRKSRINSETHSAA